MKRLSIIIVAAAVVMTLTGCGLYDKYESKVAAPDNAFGTSKDVAEAENGKSLAEMSWREFFVDPVLQNLIEQVLANNTDLNSARIAVEKSEASLKAAKMAYLPSLYFSPQGTLSKFDSSPWSKTYNLPLQLSVDVDVFGSITNKKRASQAVLLQAQLAEEAIRTNLISAVAQQYYMLQLLDHQLDILIMTDSLWNASLETQKSLYENGKAYSTAVNQMESSYLNVKTQIVDTRRSVPATMLELRPDIRMANHAMEEAFYNTQAARAAFFPTITLTGTLGWTNSGGGQLANPGKLLWNAVGQLTQPIFARGKLTANKKIAQLTEQDLQKKYVQTVLDAGNQVNEALADCQAAREKFGYYRRQVEVLYEAYTGTHELMDNGKANYIEVLTAQENLLSSQLNEATNMYKGAQAVIALYIALGGGTK